MNTLKELQTKQKKLLFNIIDNIKSRIILYPNQHVEELENITALRAECEGTFVTEKIYDIKLEEDKLKVSTSNSYSEGDFVPITNYETSIELYINILSEIDKKLNRITQLTNYCKKYDINANTDSINCFCVNKWNNQLSISQNCSSFKNWFKDIVSDYNN